VRQTTVREAITMMAKGAAEAITPDFQSLDFETWAQISAMPDHPVIRTVTLEIPVPTIIRLTTYDKLPTKPVIFSRRNLFKRDKSNCQYCGMHIKRPDEVTIDHVVPRSKGGKSSWVNCVLACIACNRRKADRTLHESGMKLVRAPVEPKVRVLISVPGLPIYQSWRSFVSDKYWDTPLEP
jgi:5-methylcytosine-specific restriction endonuclease McrA